MRSISPMNKARLGVVVGAIMMPYAVRIFGGWNWMDQYWGAGWQGFMFLQAFHAVAWVAVLLMSLLYKEETGSFDPTPPVGVASQRREWYTFAHE